jgi:hypothetical protein
MKFASATNINRETWGSGAEGPAVSLNPKPMPVKFDSIPNAAYAGEICDLLPSSQNPHQPQIPLRLTHIAHDLLF